MWHSVDGMGWWVLWGGLVMVLFWGAIIAFVVWAVQSLTGRDGGRGGSDPLEIARERYARGEISREQFEEIRQVLGGR